MPNEALLFILSGRLFHILRSACEGRYYVNLIIVEYKGYAHFKKWVGNTYPGVSSPLLDKNLQDILDR